jgi:hypothetical protein
VLALQLPHSEFLVIGIFFFLIGAVLIGIALFWPFDFLWPFSLLRKSVVTSVFPVESARFGEPPAAQAQQTGTVTLTLRTITWPSLVDPDAGELDDAERRRVIDGLGIVGDAWCASILAKAFDEEDNELRVAAVESLGLCDDPHVPPILERAYTSHVIAERYAAVDGASRLAYVPLLERALRDTDATVAIAAAYGLHRANRNDLVETTLADRTDAGAREIRRVLDLLS